MRIEKKVFASYSSVSMLRGKARGVRQLLASFNSKQHFSKSYAGITLRYSVEARSKRFSFKSWRRIQELEDGLDKLKR
ncbi:hypothetical protein FBEOM_10572 [Fusarium beomiforme]|uniref:Uncharacterized protein n=1 Tax=Fusarium beomiforme TaxID=44412 RepID=A0A9P5AC50_9HYPO|nr:hypothetical protein FBEOM_10572 [Fusarium beomiforme]